MRTYDRPFLMIDRDARGGMWCEREKLVGSFVVGKERKGGLRLQLGFISSI